MAEPKQKDVDFIEIIYSIDGLRINVCIKADEFQEYSEFIETARSLSKHAKDAKIANEIRKSSDGRT